ncbi:prolyl oligopeptidase family serine peptidase [candidate division WOR-3 bacterium]|nr:prolyl oligopeptidase family serine peptidase [candidate division WOR-3 bacterium]
MFLILSLLSSLPSIQDTIFPQEYLVCGPFLSGVREGSWRNLPDDTAYVPKEGDSLFSVLATGGWVYWEKVEVDSTGWLTTNYSNVKWDTLQDFYGISALFNSGYACAEIKVPQRSRALAIAKRCGFSINKQSYAGDIYGHGYVKVPVVLEEGINRIWVRLGGAGDDRVFFKLVPVDNDVRLITKDATLPDLVYGRENSQLYGAIPVSNTSEQWTRNTRNTSNPQLIVGGGAFGVDTFDLPPIAPMSFYKAPFEFALGALLPDSVPGDTLILPVAVVWEGGRTEATLTLRCREPDQSRKETFISAIDNSVQYYGIMPPRNYDPARKYPLIFSLHGAGVEAIGLVGAYTQKDWAFVVSPTNRRPFGFDWQDWGRLDALEVLEQVKERYPIDENRIHLTGHSMGGHGAWHVGLTHPDLFASASPGAGWTNHELYVPWTWQKSAIYAEPWQLEIRNQALRTDNQLARVENASNLPIYILQGGADDNVPAFQARLYAKRLAQLGFSYHYEEVPEKPHWWSDSGIACVNWPGMMEFMQDKVRNSYPEHVYYRSADLTQENGAYWLSIHAVKDRYQDAIIEGWQEDSGFKIKATNMSRFALRLEDDMIGKTFNVQIDDATLSVTPNVDSMAFEIGKNGWQRAKSDSYPLPHPPIKGAYYEPFILVHGTMGDSTTNARLFSMARGEAQAWWVRANGRVMIVPDTAVTEEMINSYNLILYGNATENAITAGIEKSLPIRIEDGRFVFADEILPPEATASLFVYRNPLNPNKKVLVREGIGTDGLKLSGYFSTLYSGAGVPDYLIWSDDVWDKGWGGVIKAGFFTADWKP